MTDRTQADPRVDLAVALLLIVVCGAVLWETGDIAPPVFEPLGSAAIPQAVAVLIMLLSGVVLIRALARRRGTGSAAAAGPARYLDAVAVLGLTALYVLAMQWRLLSFALITAAFLTATIGLLVRFRPRRLPLVLAVALAVGYGCQYLFTRVFIVDLPGL